MQLSPRLERPIRAQFGRPTGIPGRMAGWVMGHRASNRQRNIWAVSLLDVRPDDRVLELGFGPGVAIAELSRLASAGKVCGVDHSEVMLRAAAKRNAVAAARGQVELRLGSVETLPDFDGLFDKILAVNAMMFWADPVARLMGLRSLLKPDGQIAIALQPRGSAATRDAATEGGQRVASALRDAGFSQVRIETLELKPAVICTLGVNPSSVDPPAGAAALSGSREETNGS